MFLDPKIPTKRSIALFTFILMLLLFSTFHVQAATAKKGDRKPATESIKTVDAPVVFNNKTLFTIHVSILSFSPQDRARLIGNESRNWQTIRLCGQTLSLPSILKTRLKSLPETW